MIIEKVSAFATLSIYSPSSSTSKKADEERRQFHVSSWNMSSNQNSYRMFDIFDISLSILTSTSYSCSHSWRRWWWWWISIWTWRLKMKEIMKFYSTLTTSSLRIVDFLASLAAFFHSVSQRENLVTTQHRQDVDINQ